LLDPSPSVIMWYKIQALRHLHGKMVECPNRIWLQEGAYEHTDIWKVQVL